MIVSTRNPASQGTNREMSHPASHSPAATTQQAAPVASTKAFVTFVFYQAFTLLIVRHPTRSVFTREALENSSAFIATGAVVVMLILVVQLNALHGFFTTDLTPRPMAGLRRGQLDHPVDLRARETSPAHPLPPPRRPQR